MNISVIIPTYNPDPVRLNKTLAGLRLQTLDISLWELIIIDNNSIINFKQQTDLSWHPSSKIVFEAKQGLTYARLKGFAEAKGDTIIMVDDDNILDPGYLERAAAILKANTKLGAIGGKSIPQFESTPPTWLNEFYGNLALRDLGETVITDEWADAYPTAAPIGAGMVIRKSALRAYIDKATSGSRVTTDRTGESLSSGGDNEIIITILQSGFITGYFPELVLQHIIPKERTTTAYLGRLLHDTNKSWVKLLDRYGINPWKKISKYTLGVRKLKAYLTHKAWQGEANYIRWQAACGLFEGLTK